MTGITLPPVFAQRGADGNWPERPDTTGTVIWADTTTWQPSDPAGFIEGLDLIFDEGTA